MSEKTKIREREWKFWRYLIIGILILSFFWGGITGPIFVFPVMIFSPAIIGLVMGGLLQIEPAVLVAGIAQILYIGVVYWVYKRKAKTLRWHLIMGALLGLLMLPVLSLLSPVIGCILGWVYYKKVIR